MAAVPISWPPGPRRELAEGYTHACSIISCRPPHTAAAAQTLTHLHLKVHRHRHTHPCVTPADPVAPADGPPDTAAAAQTLTHLHLNYTHRQTQKPLCRTCRSSSTSRWSPGHSSSCTDANTPTPRSTHIDIDTHPCVSPADPAAPADGPPDTAAAAPCAPPS